MCKLINSQPDIDFVGHLMNSTGTTKNLEKVIANCDNLPVGVE